MGKLGLYFAAVCIVVSVLLASMPHSHVKADDDRGSIVGTWIFAVTLAPGFVETELAAFDAGGTETLTSSVFNAHSSRNPFLPPFLMVDFSDVYGAWKRQGTPIGSLQH